MKEPKGKRRISRAGRARMAAAGRENLDRWKAQAPTRARELEAQVNAYRDSLLRDVGPNPTATKAGLIEAATTTYASILIVRTKLVHSRRADVAVLTERVSWLTSSLSRCLKTLDIGAKPRPRTLADIVAPKPSEVATKSTV